MPNTASALAELPTDRTIRIVGTEAADIARHVATYVQPGRSWSEVQGMRECDHGCKLYVRKQGAVLQYRLIHSVAYGCALGCDAATAEVPVSVAPKGSPVGVTRLIPRASTAVITSLRKRLDTAEEKTDCGCCWSSTPQQAWAAYDGTPSATLVDMRNGLYEIRAEGATFELRITNLGGNP